MKKNVIKLDKPFSLDKETIAKLTNAQMSTLVGGKGAVQEDGYITVTTNGSCHFQSCNEVL